MYRYRVDNAVTYTPEDFILFREAPFACWMERLTLDNPDHGIPPDIGSEPPPRDGAERQDDLADTLGAEGKDVRLIAWDEDEPGRRSATLDAMHEGADFIVNGQLALGPLSGAANLLVRTSGYSQLGEFLYVPCDTQTGSTRHSAFRLCFLADLLHGLQGQLPPQILIVRDGDDLVPLQTDSHIYHYRSVKKRFMAAMQSFRKHRMPDPAESSHFGRWSDCAHEVLKQRLLREDSKGGETVAVEYAEPLRRVAGVAGSGGATPYDLDDIRPPVAPVPGATALTANHDSASQSASARPDLTLVEQARILKPGTYKPGPGVYRFGPPREPAPTAAKKHRFNRRASDRAPKDLEIFHAGEQSAGTDGDPVQMQDLPRTPWAAPASSLRGPRGGMNRGSEDPAAPLPRPLMGGDKVEDRPAEDQPPRRAPVVSATPPPRPGPAGHSAIDLDETHRASPPQQLSTSGAAGPVEGTFSNSLITSDESDG